MTDARFQDFKRIFEPKKVAIVGVAAEGFNFGKGILLSLQTIGFNGEIYPVNPRGGTVAGLPIYETIEEIPGDIDFAIIAVPAKHVPGAVESCRKKGAAGVEILSSGFKEVGTDEGALLEEQIRESAAKGIRVIGPNCFGIYSPRAGLTLLPGPDLSRETGPVAFVSQSGGMSIDFADIGLWKGIRFSKIISFGNGADLRETELLEYLGTDEDTKIISMYIEGVENGRKFFNTLKDVAAKKPVIIFKGGLSDAGRRAVASHTASMGGQRIIWESLIRQCNAIQVTDLREMSDTSLALSYIPEGVYKGLSIVGGGGALGVAAADLAESYGMFIPVLEQELQDAIFELLPKPGSSATNPVDIANPYAPPKLLKETLVHAAKDKNVDIQVVTQLFFHYKALAVMLGADSIQMVTPYKELVDAVSEAQKETGKPIVMVLPQYKQELESIEVETITREARKLFLEKGIPVFDEMKDALKALGNVTKYYEKKRARSQKEL
ncbi:MAG: hypothetical protein GY754_27815 [bacterium]|nr:hypothetical protein [bacterium]